MITPYYEKGSLANLIFNTKDDKLADAGKFNIIFGIASAMKYLHDNDISHRDLKPGNILLDDQSYPILIDFGISRRNIEEMKTIIGSDNYLAPELYTEDVYNEKVDVYSFGLIILEMYSKKLTFNNIPWGQMVNKKLENKIEICKKMPPFLKKIVKDCLNPNPLKRPDFGKILTYLYANNTNFLNSAISTKFIKYINITRKQKLFFRMPKQIFKTPKSNWNGDIDELINWIVIDQILESSKDKKIILIMLFGPYGHGKSTYLKHLTGNQAFICGNNEKTTTLGIYIDGKYTVDDIKNQVSEMIAPDYLELFDSLNLDDNYHIYFLDSQGIGDDKYLNQKDILDRINSIFCSSSSACISIQSSNEDGSLKSVFQISRSIQFSSLTKQFFLVRNYNVFNSLTDLSYESLNDFQQNDMENYKKERKSILELYDVKNIMLMGFGDMANMDSFYISIWFSFYSVLSNLKDEIIYSSSEIKNKLKSKAKMFFWRRVQTI